MALDRKLFFDIFSAGRRIRDFLIYYALGLYNRANDHHIFLLAGGLAFSLFVCILPLALVIFAAIGMILDVPNITRELSFFIDRVVPYQEYSRFVKDFIFMRLEDFRIHKNLAGIIGALGLLFAASGLFSSMRTALDLIYKVRGAGSIIINKLRDFLLILIVLLFILMITAILPAWAAIDSLAERVDILNFLRLGQFEDTLIRVVSFLIILGSFYVIYAGVPHRKKPRKALLLSAVAAAILWEVARSLFGFYIGHFASLKQIYGAYALMVVVASWIYYTSLVFILGAEIGQLFQERKEPVQTAAP